MIPSNTKVKIEHVRRGVFLAVTKVDVTDSNDIYKVIVVDPLESSCIVGQIIDINRTNVKSIEEVETEPQVKSEPQLIYVPSDLEGESKVKEVKEEKHPVAKRRMYRRRNN